MARRPESWDRAADILRKALANAGLPYDAEEGEAAFYGPKIDVQVADSCSSTKPSLSTIQVKLYSPSASISATSAPITPGIARSWCTAASSAAWSASSPT